MLRRVLSRFVPQRLPDVVIVRRAESARAKVAAHQARLEELRAANLYAQSLGRVSEPMTPRHIIAEQVRAERAARKESTRTGAGPKMPESGLVVPVMRGVDLGVPLLPLTSPVNSGPRHIPSLPLDCLQ